MKRIKQLHPLSKEHHASLSLGQKAIVTAKSGDMVAIKALAEKIVAEYPQQWRVHFDIEEESIFTPFAQRDAAITVLCEQLFNEHCQLDQFYRQMQSGDYSVLLEFGTLLKQHTRTEERELFPLLTERLCEEELDTIYDTSVLYREASHARPDARPDTHSAPSPDNSRPSQINPGKMEQS